jgi:hypothetical protein
LSASRLATRVGPVFERARAFLAGEMDAGRLRRSDPSMLLLSLYSTVVGVATELEVQRAIGIEPTLRATVQRRRELLRFLEVALTPTSTPTAEISRMVASEGARSEKFRVGS